jgi:ABC-2 type transport system permease protein
VLGGAGELNEKIDALVVIGPQIALPDRALWQIDQFLMKGKGVAMFVTNTRPDMRSGRPTRVGSGLDPLLGHYGIELRRDIVLDRVANGAMRLPVREGDRVSSREVNSPLIPKATDLSHRNPLTSGLDTMLFPFASSLGVASPLPDGVKAEVLARSSDTAGSVQALKTMDPDALKNVLSSEKRGPFDLMVALTGSWRSFFETRGAPAADPEVDEEQDGLSPDSAPIVEGGNGRMVVAGSSDFIANNPTFMLNVADWLVQDEGLIGIRSKLANTATLQPTESTQRGLWRGFNLLTAPLLLGLIWATRQLRLRRSGG